MMRKTLAMVAAFTLAIGLLACLSGCSGSGSTSASSASSSKILERGNLEYEGRALSEPIVLLDDDDLKIVATDKFQGANGTYDGSDPSCAGYLLTITNKSSSKYYRLDFDNTSVDGTMSNMYCNGSNTNPGTTNESAYVYIQKRDYSKLSSMDDIKNIKSTMKILYNTDGGNSFRTEDTVSIELP